MGEEDAFQAGDQYFFGSELVAAPFITPSDPQTGRTTRKVWLPEGRWFEFFTGKEMGSGWQEVSGELEEIPVFARGGAIVPLGPKAVWGSTANPPELDVYVFPGADNRFELYEDDGETLAFQQGGYALTPLSVANSGATLTFTIQPAEGDTSSLPERRTWRVHLRGVGPEVHADRTGVYDPARRTLEMEPVTLTAKEGMQLRFTLE
jgi:alpha-glucosidase (family GH31 glycosyl hydrolase)